MYSPFQALKNVIMAHLSFECYDFVVVVVVVVVAAAAVVVVVVVNLFK